MSLDISAAIATPTNGASIVSSDTDSTLLADKTDKPDAFATVLNDKLSENSPSVAEKDDGLANTESAVMADINIDIPDSGEMETSILLKLNTDATANQVSDNPPAAADEAKIQALMAMLPHQIANTLETRTGKTAADISDKKLQKANAIVSEQLQLHTKSPAVIEPESVWFNRINNHALPADTAELTRFADTSGNTAQEKIPFQQIINSPGLLPGNGIFTESGVSSTAPASAELTAQLGSKEWQQTLGQQILLFSRNGQQNAQLRLHPQDLGTVHVRLSLEDNMAQLHFASAQGQVRAALEAAMPGLRSALAEGGIHLGQSTVSSDTASQWQQAEQNSDNREGNDHTGITMQPMEQKSLGTSVTLEALAAGSKAIDVFA
jgi:hypothetical protein